MLLARLPGSRYVSLLLACTLLVASFGRPTPAHAETFTVTTLAESGAGSLRQAIINAHAGDTITITATGTIDLTSGLTIDKALNIVGPGAKLLTVRRSTDGGTPNFGVFTVNPGAGATVRISGLTIGNGHAVSGGGIAVLSGVVTITACAIDGNVSESYGGGFVISNSTVTVKDSTLSNNQVLGSSVGGGAMFVQGAAVTVESSTLSHNSAPLGGSAILAFATSGEMTTVTVRGSTAAYNPSGQVFAFYAFDDLSSSSLHLHSTLIANNNGPNFFLFGHTTSIISDGHNLDDDGSSNLTDGTNGDIVGNLDAKIADLADNGGPTKTHALLAGSPALEAGIATSGTDQRGFQRVSDDPTKVNGSDGADIGAFEAQSPLLDLNGSAAGLDFSTSYIENTNNDPVPIIDPTGLSLTDADGTTAVSATVVIANPRDGSSESLGFDPSIVGATTNFVQSTYTLTLTCTSLASCQQALQTVRYRNTSTNPTTGTREVRFAPSDGVVTGRVATANVTVGAVNNPPMNLLPAQPSTNEDTPLTLSSGGGRLLSISDDDVGAGSLKVQLKPTHGTVTLNGTAGLTVTPPIGSPDVTVIGGLTAINTALNGLVFTPEANYSGQAQIQIITNDQQTAITPGALSDDDTLPITIVAVNDRPTIDPIGPQSTDEDTQSTQINVTIGDIDTGADSLTLSALAADTSLVPSTPTNIAIGGSGTSRTLKIKPADNLSGTTNVTVTVSDGTSTASQTFVLTVNPVDDAPVNAVPAAQTVNQNSSLVFSSGNGNLIAVSDVDAGSSPVTVTLTPANGTVSLNGTSGLTVANNTDGPGSIAITGPLGSINNALNGLRFTPTPGYSGSASLKVKTDDLGNTGAGGPKSDSDTIAITVAPFRAAPTISEIADQSTGSDGSTPTVPFTINSTEVPPANLTVTATSSNTALVPASGIQITGNGIARAIKVTAAPHQSGETTVDVKVSDGTAEAHKTFKLTVLQVSQTPTGVPDSYSLGSIQSLTVPAASGVLANDTVPADGTLMAEIVSGTSHGVLNLMSNGGFTYTPATGFTGTDTFTYRSRNGSFSSDPVAVTITVLTSRCAPLATVKVTTATVNGKLQATVTAQPVDQQTNNRLVELRFGSFQNGKVTLDGQPIASGATYTPSARATSVTFVVERVTPGQATTIPLTAVDECGAWPTFVGGGSGAGF